MAAEFITIARVVKPQGRIGEVAADLHTDFPERFAERSRLYLTDASGARRELEVEQHWFHKGRVVLKFAGVDSITDAQALTGCEIQVPVEERAELESGAVYVSELVGCKVFDRGHPVGEVAEVEFGAGEAPLLIVRQDAKEHMVPFAEEYLKHLDTATKRIDMELPEGMLELDAPLSAEEKQRQHGDS